MSTFQREVFVCFTCLYVVSLCVTHVRAMVLNAKPDVSNKSSDFLKITPSDIDNVLTQNGLFSHELQKADGKELDLFVSFY